MQASLSSYIMMSFVSFLRHVLGTVIKPYETFRELTKNTYPLESLFIGFLVVGYIGLASILRRGLDIGPLLLTLRFGKIAWGIFFTFIFVWGSLYFVGRAFGGKGTPWSLFLPWVYSLLPTIIWFLVTSFFYFLLPPPRTTSLTGQVFSVVFIVISLTLFYWKGLLYYLTLRLGHKLDLLKILLVSLVVFPLGMLYSVFTYKLGLFRVPFI